MIGAEGVSVQRRLSVILSADVVRYSGLMEADEAGTLERLKLHRARVFDPYVAIHGGRLFKLMGDGALVEFPSVVAAVECALAIQDASERAAADEPDDKRLRYRIGIDLGEVMIDGDDIYGTGVNMASRLQGLAPHGGVALSRVVKEQADGKANCVFEDLGEQMVKNIERPVHMFLAKPGIASGAHASPAGATGPSVCVLPFANISSDPEQEYFSDGITEDVITDLSKVSSLFVVARNTAFQFKGRNPDVGQVARKLKVTHVLEGSVRKAGGRVRITAQLIDGETGGHVWAERFDRDLSDIFALQDEISEAIVTALKVTLLPEEKSAIRQRGTSDVEAYNLCLMARQEYVNGAQGTPQWGETIIRLSRRATEIDPNYAEAWALLALGQVALRWDQGGDETGVAAADRALALAPGLADARAVKARVSSDAGRHEDAIREILAALEKDPESFLVNYTAGLVFFYARRTRDATRYFEKAIALNEADFHAPRFLMGMYAHAGDRDGALRVARITLEHVENTLARDRNNGYAYAIGSVALAELDQFKRAREWVNQALLLNPDNVAVRFAVGGNLAARFKEVDAALDVLGPAFSTMSAGWLGLFDVTPDFEGIRDHPRFKSMMAAAKERIAAAGPKKPAASS